jgi:hypothetical protein
MAALLAGPGWLTPDNPADQGLLAGYKTASLPLRLEIR